MWSGIDGHGEHVIAPEVSNATPEGWRPTQRRRHVWRGDARGSEETLEQHRPRHGVAGAELAYLVAKTPQV